MQTPTSARRTGADAPPVVIVGAGAAGFSAAGGVRAAAPEVPVIVLGDEPDMTWDRPPLSKEALRGPATPGREVVNAARLKKLAVDLRLGHRAVGVDIEARLLLLADGTSLEWGDLVVATGARPRSALGVGGDGIGRGVHVLRTQHDAAALRAELVPGARLVVVGAGFLGLEVAASARGRGCDVTVLEATDRPLESRLGPEVARRVLDLHERRGVRLLAGTAPAGFERDARSGAVTGLRLVTEDVLPADVVLLAIGCEPTTAWLGGSGLDVARGVRCDAFLQAGPGLWAAGDAALWRNQDVGDWVRFEHRANAAEQGALAGRNVVASRKGETLSSYVSTPYFWTDQYDAKVQSAGYSHLADDETVGPSADGQGLLVRRWRGDVLIGVLAWNAPKEFLALRRELSESLDAARPLLVPDKV